MGAADCENLSENPFGVFRQLEEPRCLWAPGFSQKGLERREVEKRIYGVRKERLTASATFLLLRYPTVLNVQ